VPIKLILQWIRAGLTVDTEDPPQIHTITGIKKGYLCATHATIGLRGEEFYMGGAGLLTFDSSRGSDGMAGPFAAGVTKGSLALQERGGSWASPPTFAEVEGAAASSPWSSKGRSGRLEMGWGRHTNQVGSVESVEEAGRAEAGEGGLRRMLGAPPPGRSLAVAHPDLG
jgi:hypothetical protein